MTSLSRLRDHCHPARPPARPQDNSVSLTATNVAAGLVRRERGDRIHLVTVVPSEAQRGEGANLMERLRKAFRTHVDVLTHVLVGGEGGEGVPIGPGQGWARMAAVAVGMRVSREVLLVPRLSPIRCDRRVRTWEAPPPYH
jgi:hypothetical protein